MMYLEEVIREACLLVDPLICMLELELQLVFFRLNH
jgi:hypothetical protein